MAYHSCVPYTYIEETNKREETERGGERSIEPVR
jgi:hypothetical protein